MEAAPRDGKSWKPRYEAPCRCRGQLAPVTLINQWTKARVEREECYCTVPQKSHLCKSTLLLTTKKNPLPSEFKRIDRLALSSLLYQIVVADNYEISGHSSALTTMCSSDLPLLCDV